MSFYHAPTFLRSSIARNPFCHGGLIQPEDILRFEAEFPTLFGLPGPPTPKESPKQTKDASSDYDEDIRGEKAEKVVTSKPSTPTRRKQNSTVIAEQKSRIRKREPTPTNTSGAVPRKREERPCGISQFHKNCFQNQGVSKKEVKRNVKAISPNKDNTSIPLKKKSSGLLQRPAQSFSLENLRETLKQVLEEDFYQHKLKFEKSKSPYTEDLVKKFFGKKLQEMNQQKAANQKRNVPKRGEIARNDENSDISEVAIWLDSPQHKKKLGTRLDQTNSKRQSPLQEKVEKIHVVKSAPGFLRGPPSLPPAPSLNYLKKAQKSIRKQVGDPPQRMGKQVTWQEESGRGDGDASRALQPKASNPDGFGYPKDSRSKVVGNCICGRKIKASRAKSEHLENEESESGEDERHSKRRITKSRRTSRSRSLSRSGGFLQDRRFPSNSRYHIPLPTSVESYENVRGGLRNFDAPSCIKPTTKKSDKKQISQILLSKQDVRDNSKYAEDFIQDVISVKSIFNSTSRSQTISSIRMKSQSKEDGNDNVDNSKCSEDFIQEDVISIKPQSIQDGNDNSKYADDFIQEDEISVKWLSNQDGDDNVDNSTKCSEDFIQEDVISVKSQPNQDGNDNDDNTKCSEDFIQDVISVKSQSKQDDSDNVDNSKCSEDFIQEDEISEKSLSNQNGNDNDDNSKCSEDFIQDDVISVKSQSNQDDNDNSKYAEDFILEDEISVKSQSNQDGNDNVDNSKCSEDFIQEDVISIKSQSNQDRNDNSKYAEDFIQEDEISVKSLSNQDVRDNSKYAQDFIQDVISVKCPSNQDVNDNDDNTKCSEDFIQDVISVKSQSNQERNDKDNVDDSKCSEDFIQKDVISVKSKSKSNQDGNDNSKYAEDFIQEDEISVNSLSKQDVRDNPKYAEDFIQEDVISVKSQSNHLRTTTPPIRDVQNLSLEEELDDLSSSRETVMDLVSEGELLEVEAVHRSPGEVSSSEEVNLESISNRSPGEVTDSGRLRHSLSNSSTRSSTSGSGLRHSSRGIKISPPHSKNRAFNSKLSDGERSGISLTSEGLVADSSPGKIMSIGEHL